MIRILRLVSHDPDFCRGVRRGVGLILASFVISQCLICARYSLIMQSQGVSGQAPQSTPEMVYITYLPIIHIGPRPAMKCVCGWAGFDRLDAACTYSWTWNIPPGDPRFMPMIRDRQQLEHLAEAVVLAEASGWLMGFNEPDMPEPYGNEIPPSEAAEMWRQIEKQAHGIKLLSPAPSQEDFDWLWRMVAEYQGRHGRKPRFDAIGVHWYNWQSPNDVQPAKDYLLRVRREALAHGYDVPIWLTEFGGDCRLRNPQSGNERLMRELIPWMRQQPWMGRFFWFMAVIRPDLPWCKDCTSCSLLDHGTLEPTPLGEIYKEIK